MYTGSRGLMTLIGYDLDLSEVDVVE